MSFTHLHVHSVYSLYHSTLTVKDAVDKAVRMGMNALAITDYDNMFAAHDFVRYSNEVDPSFKPIIGCELHVTPFMPVGNSKLPLQKAPHLTVLCKNEKGYENLCKLLEIAWNEGFHFCPTVSFEQLSEFKEGLIVLSGCPGSEIAKHFLSGDQDAAEEAILKYRDLFGEDYYVELVRNGSGEQLESAYSDFLLNMGKKHGIKVVAANDVHRCEKEDIQKMEHLLQANLGDMAKSIPLPTDDWLKSEKEMLSQFPDCPEAISATEEIVAKIETFEVPQWKVPSPRWNEEEYLRDLDDCRKIIDKYYSTTYDIMEEFLRPYTDEEFDNLFKGSGYPEVVRQYCKEILAEWMNALIDGEVEDLDNPQDVLEAWQDGLHEKPTVREEAWTKVGPYVQVYLSEREYGQSHEWARKYTQELLDEDSKFPYDDTFNEIRQTNPPASVDGLLKLFRHVAQGKGEDYLYYLVLAYYDGWGEDSTIEGILRSVEKFFPIYQQQLADGHFESYAEAYGEAIIFKGWSVEESSNYAAIIEQAMANGSDYEQAAEIAQLLTDEHLCLKEDEFLKEFKEEWHRELYYQQYIGRYNGETKNEVRQRIGLRPLDEHSSTE